MKIAPQPASISPVSGQSGRGDLHICVGDDPAWVQKCTAASDTETRCHQRHLSEVERRNAASCSHLRSDAAGEQILAMQRTRYRVAGAPSIRSLYASKGWVGCPSQTLMLPRTCAGLSGHIRYPSGRPGGAKGLGDATRSSPDGISIWNKVPKNKSASNA